MSGKTDVIRAVDMCEQYPIYLQLRWENILTTLLNGDALTVNEIIRILKINPYLKNRIHVTLNRMKVWGRVRKLGRRYQLADEKIMYYKQRNLREF